MSTITELAKSANENRVYDTLGFAGAVNAGALNALQAAFTGKAPTVLAKYQEALLGSLKKPGSNQGTSGDADALLTGFGGLGKIQKVSHGRRKNRPQST